MPRKIMVSARLSAAQLSALAPTGEEFDIADPAVAGLVLRVGPTGSKRWLFRYRWRGERPRIALGEFPQLGLAQARALALAHRGEIKRGIDPRKSERPFVGSTAVPTQTAIEHLRGNTHTPKALIAAPAPEPSRAIGKPVLFDKTSFHFLAYEFVEYFVKPRRDVPKEVIRILVKDALPFWKERDARTITPREIIERLDAIVARGAPVMANRTAAILDQMFRFGVHRSIVADSPVKLLFAPGGKETPRDRVLSEEELQRFLQGLPIVCTAPVRRHSLMVLLLTLVRRGSLAAAKWCEFDFNAKTWAIPAQHDKERRAHVVPLTDWAIEELLALKAHSNGSQYVLPKRSTGGEERPSSGELISRSVTRLREQFEVIGIAPFTPHDLRRTGRTLLSMLGTSEEIAERVLNHSRGEMVGTYDLFKFVPQNRAALERLSEWLGSLVSRQAPSPDAQELIRLWLATKLMKRDKRQRAERSGRRNRSLKSRPPTLDSESLFNDSAILRE
jgi:integrase